MKMITKAIEKKLMKYPLLSQEGKGEEAEVILKVFNPYGRGTWLITEAEKQGEDWLFFGYMEIGTWEWGYVTLKELEGVKFFGGLGLERDLYCKNMTVAQCVA